jgi:UDP-2,3-diacylglucosamine pyrophosphatase LpxH
MSPPRESMPPALAAPRRAATRAGAAPERDGEARRLRYRAIFISDLHLGTPGCQAVALLDFLRRTESDDLYLVGDIVDGWQLRRRWYWHQSHNDVIQKLLRKARKGTRVVFVPGNHDEGARDFVGVAFGDIVIQHEAVHTTADGRRLLVTHGDLFDGVIRCARWLALLGDVLYTVVLRLNRHFNAVRARLGLPYWSLSQYLKHKVKDAVSYIGAFEEAVAREARQRGFDGVVCGHIHHAEMRRIGDTLYCNDGDWVESLTALVEHDDGRLEIVRWSEVATHAGGTDALDADAEHAAEGLLEAA